jgi:hypothetical protein
VSLTLNFDIGLSYTTSSGVRNLLGNWATLLVTTLAFSLSNYRKVGQTWPGKAVGKAVAKYFKIQVLRADIMLVCVNDSSDALCIFIPERMRIFARQMDQNCAPNHCS